METFSRGQQVIVLLIILGMTLIYFISINKPDSQQVVRAVPASQRWAQPTLPYDPLSQQSTDRRPPTSEKLTGAKLLTLNKKIDINTATTADMEAVRGIGPKTAIKIIEFRHKHGRFERVEDIMKVHGIKEKKFEKIRRYLTVE